MASFPYWLLPLLNSASLTIASFLGMYGVLHDFRVEGKLTRAGRRAIALMVVAAFVKRKPKKMKTSIIQK